MNTNMPGFTAEGSLYKTSRHYRMLGALDLAKRSIVLSQQALASRISCYSECYLDCMDCDRSRPGCPLPSECASGCRCRCFDICPPPPEPQPQSIDECRRTLRSCLSQYCILASIFGGPLGAVICTGLCAREYLDCVLQAQGNLVGARLVAP